MNYGNRFRAHWQENGNRYIARDEKRGIKSQQQQQQQQNKIHATRAATANSDSFTKPT